MPALEASQALGRRGLELFIFLKRISDHRFHAVPRAFASLETSVHLWVGGHFCRLYSISYPKKNFPCLLQRRASFTDASSTKTKGEEEEEEEEEDDDDEA